MSLQVTGTGSAGASRTAFQTYKRTRHDPTARKVVQLTKWGGRGGGGCYSPRNAIGHEDVKRGKKVPGYFRNVQAL